MVFDFFGPGFVHGSPARGLKKRKRCVRKKNGQDSHGDHQPRFNFHVRARMIRDIEAIVFAEMVDHMSCHINSVQFDRCLRR